MYEKQFLHSLITDCETYRLSEKESMEYIRRKTDGQFSISSRHYYRIKKYIRSEPACQRWMNHEARIGFVIEHKKRIDEMELVQRELMKLLLKETAREEIKQDKNLILKISSQIESANKRLSELSLGTPVVAEIKNRVKEAGDAQGVSANAEYHTRGTDQNRIF